VARGKKVGPAHDTSGGLSLRRKTLTGPPAGVGSERRRRRCRKRCYVSKVSEANRRHGKEAGFFRQEEAKKQLKQRPPLRGRRPSQNGGRTGRSGKASPRRDGFIGGSSEKARSPKMVRTARHTPKRTGRLLLSPSLRKESPLQASSQGDSTEVLPRG